jgi:methylenetetrahydrofolate dehydrogenase (NADP+)/methenyltetrahydrofolate cyclohydrolase
MSICLEAKPVRKERIRELKTECANLKMKGVVPNLKVVLVGDDPASVIYTTHKKKFCEKIGARCEIIKLPSSTSESHLLDLIGKLASDDDVNGILIQLPLPQQLGHLDVGNIIPPNKDVDGFSDFNIAKIVKNENLGLKPCTPKGILSILDYYKIPLEGSNICVIGRSMIVGKPLSIMLTNRNATVVLCHSKSKNIKDHTKRADIIISAIGKPKFITKDFLSDDRKQTIIDVGMNHDDDGQLCGDTNYSELLDKCAAITPVPGGIGPMTILSLAENLVIATKSQKNLN